MNTLKKISHISAVNHSPKHVDSSSTIDLERLVRQPRHSSANHGAVAARMFVGVLIPDSGLGDSCLRINVDGEILPVQVAASCLLKVHAGDWVHAVLARDEVWVLSVLTRAEAGNDAVHELDFGGSELHISANKIRISAVQHLDMRAPLLTQHAQNRQSQIDGTDSAHVGNSLVHADSHLSLHARSAMVTAASLLKVDAAQIHMG